MSAEAGRENAMSLRTPPTSTNTGQAASVKIKGAPSKYVKLNVGGTLFYTTIGTLTKLDNMLRAMFSGRMEVLTDSEGWILIDRNGKHFGTILNFLRDGKSILPRSRQDLEELQAEAKYYLVSELLEKCQKALKLKKDEFFPVCRIPVITSPRESKAFSCQNEKAFGETLVQQGKQQVFIHKVEFPEARILEETLNVLLYEEVESESDDFVLILTLLV
ncbi:putative BTB/POZ domain-containing adapter for CUL3-mediated RhoA degradation protein 3 [Apostichopus japonicus]|uniref:Putative BTB/POZ domain-containing adapter for CUL3-mediated RhoA degradation protein 3 n=1 Tax=Stichopus japonicus TaxID=307972 RepID=A0A2G8K3Y7_STIJA|nr:putative BTB/POZ domain-containing adapter for CUL3-mediated RhoA degradation protein 3 [Apostichopus japonicus]